MYGYEITETISKGILRLEQLRVRLDAQGPLPRMWAGRSRRDLEAEAVAASTIMEGVAVTVDEARRILAGDRPSGVTAEDVGLVDGYRDAMHYVLARADAPSFTWQSEMMLAIHHRALSGSFSAGAGRFRESQNWLTNRGSGEQVYAPPPPEAVPGLVDGVMEWMNTATDSGPVQAALVHISVAGIHPFHDGNGRTARVVASLAMYRSGFRSPFFTSLEEWWGRHIDDYYRAFDCLGAEWNATTDVTSFVEAHVSAQVQQVEALSLRNATERALWTALENLVVGDLGLSDRATHAVYDALFAREVTNGYYRGMADVSAVTASHDLGKLVAAGVLQARGAGRSARYVALPALYERVAREAGVGPEWLAPSESLLEQRDLILTGVAQRLHAEGERSEPPRDGLGAKDMEWTL